MTSVNTDRLLSTFLELVCIDSPSREEADVAAFCKQALEETGCAVHFDDTCDLTGSNTGNLFATLPAYSQDEAPAAFGSPLYFSAHMDTVDPCLGVKPQIKDGCIYSDGTTVLGSDDKAGIAAVIEMMRCMAEAEAVGEAHPEIRAVFSVQEEKGLIGAKAMDRAEFADAQGAYCYVLDAAGSPGIVVNAAPHQHSYTARFVGLAAHAGVNPKGGISAIRAAAKAIAALPQGAIDAETTTNVGTVQGGRANNIVANECLVTGEIRSHDLHKLLALKATIEDVFKEAALSADDGTGAGPAKVVIEWEVNYEGFLAPKDSPEVALALAAAKRLGFEAQVETTNGGADTNVLVAYGLAAVSLGCGMTQIHSTDEYIAVRDLEDLARLAVAIVRESQRGK